MKSMNNNTAAYHSLETSIQPRMSRKANNINNLIKKNKRLISPNPVNSKANAKNLSSVGCNATSKCLRGTHQSLLEETKTSDVMVDTCDKSNTLRLEMATNFLNKTQMLRSLLESDLLACDAKWTLFLVAALSYRYDTKLIPIPPRYIHEGNTCNVNALLAVINDTPKLSVILQNILNKNYEEMDVEVIELLYWVLVEMREPHFLRISSHNSEKILRQMNKNIRLPMYTHVFEVVATKGSHSADEFRHRIDNGNLSTRFGFLSDVADNFYVMLNCGISSKPGCNSKVTLYNDLETCVKQTPICAGWGASECGPVIICTALCEYAVTPDLLEAENAAREKRLPPLHSFIVDANMARIRYMLVCDIKRAQHKKSKRRMFSWFRRYRYCFSLVAYAIVLASIGMANCNNCELFGYLVNSKFQSLLDIFKRMIRSD